MDTMHAYQIDPFYYYGARMDAPAHIQELAQRALNKLDAPQFARYALIADEPSFYGDNLWAHWALVILDIHTGIGAGLIDYSNAQYLEDNYAESLYLDTRITGTRAYVAIPLNDDTEDNLDDDDARAEFQTALDDAERFTDYAALDEDDLSAREWASWEESLEVERPLDISDDDYARVCDYVTEHYYNHDGEAWAWPEWIREAIDALGIDA